MRRISDADWKALRRDIEALSGLRRAKMTVRESNALSRLCRLGRKMERADRKNAAQGCAESGERKHQ